MTSVTRMFQVEPAPVRVNRQVFSRLTLPDRGRRSQGNTEKMTHSRDRADEATALIVRKSQTLAPGR